MVRQHERTHPNYHGGNRERRAIHLIDSIRSLTDELEQLVLEADAEVHMERPRSVASVGSLVSVVGGKYKGRNGRITDEKGSQYWWIKEEGRNGQTFFVMRHNVCVVGDS